MKNNTYLHAAVPPKPSELSSKIKILIFILEISLIAVLLGLWFCSKAIQYSKNLWIPFFYCFPSEFLVAIVPHEPVLLYFGKFYSPLTVALVSVAGTVLAEAINYSAIKFIADLRVARKARQSKIVNKVVDFFNKAPFIALFVAGLTPIPFYPFRFLVVLANYPLIKYLLAVLISRAPRFFIISLVTYAIKIPDYLLVILFIILLLVLNIPLLINFFKNRKKKTDAA
jgi:membrane protein YqaA with SNARE-associated domain